MLDCGLYVVATPIGNLNDISARALDTLNAAEIIACEDTRVTKKLFSLLGVSIHKNFICYQNYNEEDKAAGIVDIIKGGQAVALVSDAGSPLISDPGYKLVSLCRKEGVKVYSIPGASAVICALQLAGLPTNRFMFAGFIPNKGKARAEQIRDRASAAVSAQPELDPAEVEAAAIEIIRYRVIIAVCCRLEAHGMVGVCFLDRVRVADPFAAVAVAADNDRDKEGIVRQLFCRDDVSAGVGAALPIVEAEAFDSAVVAADGIERLSRVLVTVGFVSERAHRKPQRHYRKLMVVGAGRVQEKRVGVSEFELPDILGLFLL